MRLATHRLFIGALVALSAGALQAQTTPTGTLALNATQGGNALTTEVQGADEVISGSIVINAQYSLTNQGTASAHLEIDMCSPVAQVRQVSTSTSRQLTTCLDGYGNAGAQTVLSTPITGGASSQGVTGIFSLNPQLVSTIVLDGTVWTVPARLILDSTPPVTLATAVLTLTVRVQPAPYLLKSLVGVVPARDPGNTQDGYNVTWAIGPGNAGFVGVYVKGTSTIVDPVPAAAIYVDGARQGSDPVFPSWPSFNAAHLNSNFTLTPVDGSNPASVRSVTYTIDNLATSIVGGPDGSVANVTYWYPASTTVALNSADATFANGKTSHAEARAFLGLGAGFIAKYHLCPTPAGPYNGLNYDVVTANVPNYGDNLRCAWGPGVPLHYEVVMSAHVSNSDSTPAPMHDPVMIDVLPPEVTLTELKGLFENYGQTDVSAAWSLSYSGAAGCDQNTTSWTALTLPASAATLANVRCLKAERRGLINGTQAFYTVSLNNGERAALEATPGGIKFVDNRVFISGGFSSVNYSDGSSGEATLRSTFWNSRTPGLILFNAGVASVNDNTTFSGALPFRADASINNFLGFQDLSFSATLPLEIDLRGPPVLAQDILGTPPMVDDNGNAVTLSCTWQAQNRTVVPVTPASFHCTIPGHVPSYRPGLDPFVVCPAPSYCTEAGDLFREGQPWNMAGFRVPVKIAAGFQGETVRINGNVWANPGNIASNLPVPPGNSESNPVTTYSNLVIGGTSQLSVQSSAQGLTVAVGQSARFFLDYANTGSVATRDTYVYDLFGLDPTTNQSLATGYPQFNCTTLRPTLVSVAQTAGVPATDLEYTTTSPPTIATATWSPVAPTDLSLVTGVRFRMNSAFSSATGDYGPNDAHGRELLTFAAPNDPGKKLCNMGAIVAAGFTPAGALSASATLAILDHCDNPNGCDPKLDPGQPQALNADPIACGVAVTLDASASTGFTSFTWTEGTTLNVAGVTPTVTLAPGTHVITLTGTNDIPITATATVTVTISDKTAPVMNCPASVDAFLGDNCVAAVSLNPTAQDACDGAVPVSCDTSGVATGATSVTCSATDAAGNPTSCTVAVNQPTASSSQSLTFANINRIDPALDGGACNDAGVIFDFTWVGGCGSEGAPQFSARYADANDVTHEIPIILNGGITHSNGAYTGSLYLPAGVATFSALVITGTDGSNLSQTVSLPLHVEKCPCNNVIYGPAQGGFGQVMFEDLFPSNGDLDFNDQTVAYNYEFLLDDSARNVVKLQVHYNVLSLGADLHNGLYLRLPMAANAASKIERYRAAADSNHAYHQSGAAEVIVPVAGESQLVVPIVDDSFSLFPGVTGYINTEPTLPTHFGDEVALVITLAQPIPMTSFDIGQAPFDLFIARTGNYGHQIHQSHYAGTDLADPSINGTGDDGSTGAAHYINKGGLPFALNLPYASVWPTERTSIDKGYPQILDFAQSGGTSGKGWYDNADFNTNPGALFLQGVPGDDGSAGYAPWASTFLDDLNGGIACGRFDGRRPLP